ncbi:MAG: IS3 family transposase [Bacteroidia bacterium]|jgi:putative transposase|nr:IS3 family transposase [Bacteroidia bacterium]
MINASDREQAVKLINVALKSGARLWKACNELGISKRTFHRWKETDSEFIDKRTICERPEPANKLSKEEKQEILDIVHSEEYADLPPSQIVPILADKGKYIASESSYYRVLREANEMKHRGLSKPPVKRAISTHSATAPNHVWMWDITYLNGPIKGKHYYLYLISDLFSRKIVGWEVWEEESALHASELIKRTTMMEKVATKKQILVLHSDNGSPMKGATMLETLYALGIVPSNSRPRVSNDNPYAESIFKTLKYRPNFQPKGFETLTQARLWVNRFVKWYNNEHKHSGLNFLSPIERHDGLDKEIFEKRIAVYEAAKSKHPERWTKDIRNWSLEDKVFLNPERVAQDVDKVENETQVS